MKIKTFTLYSLLIFLFAACGKKEAAEVGRPLDPWAFRSVLDKKPRMLTLALDSACFVAYDLSSCTLYKAWKGGVTMEGTVYSDKKNVQPASWGTDYFLNSADASSWGIRANGRTQQVRMISKGYMFQGNRITLKYKLITVSGDTIYIGESPEFVRHKYSQNPGLERIFETSEVPKDIRVALRFADTTYLLLSNGATRITHFFDKLPPQFPPDQKGQYDHLGKYWMESSDCLTCHELANDNVGPSFRNIAQHYPNNKETRELLTDKIRKGGSGTWGTAVMNPHPDLSEKDIKPMLDYVFSLKGEAKEKVRKVAMRKPTEIEIKRKSGFGASLEGVHPAYDIQTIHPHDFQPRVGGLAFLPDGRLVVSTWDAIGGVYLLSGVETGDTSQITVKRIAAGLAEPLGIEVVDGEIYVLQKHELTRLIDHDHDDVIDEYQAVCNSWGVTGDFHEFAFGLVYRDGYFFATLSMAMRLMDGQHQLPDRGRTIKIRNDGHFEWVNYGLRTPNGIGIGTDNEIFITDNQGQWLPANKLIHLTKGAYQGMAWGLSDTLMEKPAMTPPAIWLPDGEIGNSPSEPILMKDGPYKGQMLHGDVTNGGIKRDFVEKVNGKYQGAVFRFSQGFEAGVNRLCWGPGGALYVGGVGMVGGWSWKGKRSGLQRMKYNGKSVFEMLSVSARPNGFEVEFTEPLRPGQMRMEDWLVQQWWYLPTENYGGPKMDLETMSISRMDVSEDGKRVFIEIPGLKKEHVVYFRLPDDLKSRDGQSLWSSEAWYTLNNIPAE